MLFLSYLAWLFLTLFGINSKKDNKKSNKKTIKPIAIYCAKSISIIKILFKIATSNNKKIVI